MDNSDLSKHPFLINNYYLSYCFFLYNMNKTYSEGNPVFVSPVSMALLSFIFHCSATSFAKGSSGLGALNKA